MNAIESIAARSLRMMMPSTRFDREQRGVPSREISSRRIQATLKRRGGRLMNKAIWFNFEQNCSVVLNQLMIC